MIFKVQLSQRTKFQNVASSPGFPSHGAPCLGSSSPKREPRPLEPSWVLGRAGSQRSTWNRSGIDMNFLVVWHGLNMFKPCLTMLNPPEKYMFVSWDPYLKLAWNRLLKIQHGFEKPPTDERMKYETLWGIRILNENKYKQLIPSGELT